MRKTTTYFKLKIKRILEILYTLTHLKFDSRSYKNFELSVFEKYTKHEIENFYKFSQYNLKALNLKDFKALIQIEKIIYLIMIKKICLKIKYAKKTG